MSVNLKNELYKQVKPDLCSILGNIGKFAKQQDINTYLIGGCVRDLILKKPFNDIDIAVEGDAVKFAHILKKNIDCNISVVQDNLKTVSVEFKNGVNIDFASTREERYPVAGNLPEAFNFGCSLEKDVKRRDFTINTLAVNLNGNFDLIDIFNGYEDIKSKKIKILHKNSFIDDPSRIIRTLKFKKRLGFEYDEQTYCLMQNYLNNINLNIPMERIKNELYQYLSLPYADVYDELIKTNAYKLITDNPVKNLFDFNLDSNFKNIHLVYMILLLVKSDFYNEKLNLTHEEKNLIKETKELLNNNIKNQDYEIYKKFIKKSDEALNAYYIITKDSNCERFKNKLCNIKLYITGKDLINIGLTPSAYFSEIFESILREKLSGKIHDKEEEINYAKKMAEKKQNTM